MGKYDISESIVFGDLLRLCEKKGKDNPRSSYMTIRCLFFQILDERTENEGLSFSGPFARVHHLVKKYKMKKSLYYELNHLRVKLASLSGYTEEELDSSMLKDIRLLAEFASCAYQVSVPQTLLRLLPSEYESLSQQSRGAVVADVMRVVVNHWDEQFIYANTPCEWTEEVKICYDFPNEMGDLSVIKGMLKEDVQLNLIRPKLREGVYYPEIIIYEPDFLVDISTVADCFEDYGLTPLSYLVKRLMPRQSTQAILLGNIAGQFLDEEVFERKENSYRDSVVRFFQENALNVASCPNFVGEDFHKEARRQQQNLRYYVSQKEQEIFDSEKVLLEPSFFCEVLGVQGRVDLLTDDKRVLIEQKSGKWDFRERRHQEKHYVQMLFYLAWLRYGLGIPHDEVNCMLLYSKYPTEGRSFSEENGLIKEAPAPKLLFEAIHLRNMIAHLEVRLKEGRISLLDSLQVEDLNVNRRNGRLWTEFQKPQIEKVLSDIQSATPLERAYFYCFYSFVEKEYHLAKASFADSWNMTMEEKRQEGMVYGGLKLVAHKMDEQENGIEELVFQIDEIEMDRTPNFRKGDVVVCYSYFVKDGVYVKGGQNVCGDIVFRATIKEFEKDKIVIKLRSVQRNGSLFKAGNSLRWALEHDFIDSSFVSYFKDLFSFLEMKNQSRKDLILNVRKPALDKGALLAGEYGSFNELVLKAKRALDYFIVIGPPGTGKTSFALVNILKETLMEPSASVLLVSYTNRAVEEVCGKLIEEGIDFIRIGHEHSCTEGFDKSYLLKNRTKGITDVEQLKAYLKSTRVYVGTTASVSATKNLFSLKHFDLAIVDEASQILEPHLMGLLTACDGRAIDKFVFIGDQKQLPAVVQQSTRESEVKSEELRNVGLLDCRQSFFERILRSQGECRDFVYMLNRQGRMHPVVSDFVNKSYYDGMLDSVPLQHQEQEFFYKFDESKDGGLEGMLLTKRLFWLDVKSVYDDSSDTVNLPEAKAIAEIVYKTWKLFQLQGKVFDAQQSVGVIVPYRSQIATVRRMLEKYDVPQLLDVSIDTVERFQGSQRDVILYGTTVKKEYQLGFLSGNVFEENGVVVDRKLNVAVSRSREQMIVVGNVELLSHSRSYLPLISYLKEKNGVISF